MIRELEINNRPILGRIFVRIQGVVTGETDDASFQMITAQFYSNGYVKQMVIVRAFGVTPISIKRAVKHYKEQGVQGFYAEKKPRRAAVLTDEVLKRAQHLLSEGQEPCDVADQLGIKRDTFSKAIRAGRLHGNIKKRSRELKY